MIVELGEQQRQADLQWIDDEAEYQRCLEGAPDNRVFVKRDEVLKPDEFPTTHLAQGIGKERFFKAQENGNIAEKDEKNDSGRQE